MSEIPALRDALVRAGVRRRRRRRAVTAVVPAFGAIAAAVAFALPHGADPERDVRPSTTPVTRAFSVFARPQTAADRALPPSLASAMTQGDLDPALTRHVGGQTYALATTTGSVCLGQRDEDRVTGGCAPVEQVLGGARVAARTADSLRVLVPDGVYDIRFDYVEGGHMLSATAPDNVIGAANPDRLAALSWTDARGVRRIQRYGQQRWATTRRCVGVQPLEPLPADARALAARTALIDAVQIKSAATSAQVLSTEVAPQTSCPQAISQRLVKVDLQLGSSARTVFVGMIGGRAETFTLPRR